MNINGVISPSNILVFSQIMFILSHSILRLNVGVTNLYGFGETGTSNMPGWHH